MISRVFLKQVITIRRCRKVQSKTPTNSSISQVLSNYKPACHNHTESADKQCSLHPMAANVFLLLCRGLLIRVRIFTEFKRVIHSLNGHHPTCFHLFHHLKTHGLPELLEGHWECDLPHVSKCFKLHRVVKTFQSKLVLNAASHWHTAWFVR